jgi:hypothetical protein
MGSTSFRSKHSSHRVKTRIQASSSSGDVKGKGKGRSNGSILPLLFQILQQEGVAGFYKGFGASMLNTFSTRKTILFKSINQFLTEHLVI